MRVRPRATFLPVRTFSRVVAAPGGRMVPSPPFMHGRVAGFPAIRVIRMAALGDLSAFRHLQDNAGQGDT